MAPLPGPSAARAAGAVAALAGPHGPERVEDGCRTAHRERRGAVGIREEVSLIA